MKNRYSQKSHFWPDQLISSSGYINDVSVACQCICILSRVFMRKKIHTFGKGCLIHSSKILMTQFWI